MYYLSAGACIEIDLNVEPRVVKDPLKIVGTWQ
jgi:hypothetical protein